MTAARIYIPGCGRWYKLVGIVLCFVALVEMGGECCVFRKDVERKFTLLICASGKHVEVTAAHIGSKEK